ncbi:MAG: hypothetical protein ACOX7R_04025 [Acetivibrionales bacterium]
MENLNEGTVKVASNAVIYKLKDNGKVDKKVKRTDIEDYATLTYILDGDGIMVAAVVYGDATPGSGSGVADYSLGGATNDDAIVVAGAVYDDNNAANNNYTIKVTNLDDNTVAYYTDSIASGETELTFTIGTPAGGLATGTYRIELFRDDPSKILATFEKFLIKD